MKLWMKFCGWKVVAACARLKFFLMSLFTGPCSLAEKVASVIGCIVVSMENYRNGVDEGNDLDSIDFETLIQNLEVCFLVVYWNPSYPRVNLLNEYASGHPLTTLTMPNHLGVCFHSLCCLKVVKDSIWKILKWLSLQISKIRTSSCTPKTKSKYFFKPKLFISKRKPWDDFPVKPTCRFWVCQCI